MVRDPSIVSRWSSYYPSVCFLLPDNAKLVSRSIFPSYGKYIYPVFSQLLVFSYSLLLIVLCPQNSPYSITIPFVGSSIRMRRFILSYSYVMEVCVAYPGMAHIKTNTNTIHWRHRFIIFIFLFPSGHIFVLELSHPRFLYSPDYCKK
jgi:hypothetical protein